MVALGGWVLYLDQRGSTFISIQSSVGTAPIIGAGNVPQPGFFISTVALIGFVNLLAITVTSIHLRANRYGANDSMVKRVPLRQKSYNRYEAEDSGFFSMYFSKNLEISRNYDWRNFDV